MRVLEAREVVKEYPEPGGVVRALDDLDVSVEDGELVVVSGPSGSGKSTLLSLLAALDRPTEGRVCIFGQETVAASPSRLAALRREHVGYIFQDFCLIRHLSILDNVRLALLVAGQDPDPAPALALLDRVGLSHRQGSRPGSLSRGEMQRVAMARALVHRPRVLFADEPTASLDQKNRELVWSLILELHKEGLTTVVATHDPGLVLGPSQVVELEDGRRIEG